MKLCTVMRGRALDGQERFCVAPLGQLDRPVAFCGPTSGRSAERNERIAKLLAAAPAMLDMLMVLSKEFGNLNPDWPIEAGSGKMMELASLVSRATGLVEKHKLT